MTMLAIAVRPDGADVMTDSIMYTADASKIALTTKVATLPRAQTIVTANGESGIADLLAHGAKVQDIARNYDDLVDHAPALLRDIWAAHVKYAEPGPRAFAVVYLLGYSHKAGCFTGVICRAPHPEFRPIGFEPEPLESAFTVIPRRHHSAPPSTVDGWVELAEDVRAEQMARPPGRRVLIGGEVILTQLRQDAIVQRRIHTYDDSPEVWARYLEGSGHEHNPWDREAADAAVDDAWVAKGQPEPPATVKVPRNAPCPCGSGAKFKKCCSPDRVPA